MRLLSFFKDKLTYLLINLLVLCIGYILIQKGTCIDLNHKEQSGIYISIGTSLIAAGIVMILDLWKHFSIAEVLKKTNNIINEAGLQWVYKKRDIDKYDILMKNLSSSLDIAGYSLGAFFDSYSELMKYRVTKGNIKVRILIVDPNSQFSASRAKIEGRNPEQFKDKIETLCRFIKGLRGVEVKFFSAPLSTMIFRIDNVMFVGPHFYGAQSKATLTQELRKDCWLFDEYQMEFDRMWDDSVTVNINHD